MRSVLPALVLAAVVAAPAAAEPFITPGVVAGAVVPALVSAAIEGSVSRTYARGPYIHTSSGTYVQYYDPRTGIPVGGPVPVSPYEFARRAASIPADAPVIRVRSAATVADEGIEPVLRPRRYVRPHVYAPRPYLHGPRYGARVYAPGPRYDDRIYRRRYHARVYTAGPRFRDPVYVGPRRFAPVPFRHGRPVPGFTVVPRRFAPHHRPAPHRFGAPAHHRMGAAHPGHRGPMHHGRRH